MKNYVVRLVIVRVLSQVRVLTRPLFYVADNNEDFQVITPSVCLQEKSEINMPKLEFLDQ